MKLGDMVKSATDALGIPQCGPCRNRQQKLNKLDDRIRQGFERRFQRRAPTPKDPHKP